MRGAIAAKKRASRRAPLPPAKNTRPLTMPAPYGGWNARGNLANMAPIEAYLLDNIFPGVQDVSLRKGSEEYATGITASVEGLFTYRGPTAEKLFAADNTGIYDVSSPGAVGAVAIAGTSGRWKTTNFTNSGGSYLFGVNGTDSAVRFDGTTWINITGAGTGAITGVTTSDLSDVALHKKRIWFVQKNSMTLWYLGTDAIAGAATQFDVGGIFRKGGHVVTLGTWTFDGGSGIDDYFVIVTSEGEIALYQGTDPASASTWALVGVYAVFNPLGDRPLINYGGDLLYLTYNGLFPLSKFTSGKIPTEDDAVSYLIDGAYSEAAALYKDIFGWDMLLFPLGNFILVNVPTSTDPTAYQFVMNMTTRRWCRFTGLGALCWALYNGEIYFGSGLEVKKGWVGTSDDGVAIQGTCAQAYTNFGISGQSQVDLVRPNIGLSGQATVQMSIDSDFQTFDGQTVETYSPGAGISVWDTDLWDSAVWSSTEILIEPKWLTVPNNPGYLQSFRLQITTSSASFSWAATNFAVSPLGIL